MVVVVGGGMGCIELIGYDILGRINAIFTNTAQTYV